MKTHECRKQESCFRTLIPFGEMVMPSENTCMAAESSRGGWGRASEPGSCLLFKTAGGSWCGTKRVSSESERPRRSGACEVQRLSRLRWMQWSAGWRWDETAQRRMPGVHQMPREHQTGHAEWWHGPAEVARCNAVSCGDRKAGVESPKSWKSPWGPRRGDACQKQNGRLQITSDGKEQLEGRRFCVFDTWNGEGGFSRTRVARDGGDPHVVEYGSHSGRVVLRGQVRRCSCRQSDWCDRLGHGGWEADEGGEATCHGWRTRSCIWQVDRYDFDHNQNDWSQAQVFCWDESEGTANVARTRCSMVRWSMRSWTWTENGFSGGSLGWHVAISCSKWESWRALTLDLLRGGVENVAKYRLRMNVGKGELMAQMMIWVRFWLRSMYPSSSSSWSSSGGMRPSCAKSNVASLMRNEDREESEVSTNVRYKERGGMNSNLESIIEELCEWYHSNRDLCRTSTHRTRFKMKGPEERESSRANVSSVAGWTKSETRSAETMFQHGTRVKGQVEDICMFERPDRRDGRTDWNFVMKAHVRAIDQQLFWSVCSSTSSWSCCTSKDRRFKENAFTTDEKELERMRIVCEVDAELNMMEIGSVLVAAIRKTVMERYTVY